MSAPGNTAVTPDEPLDFRVRRSLAADRAYVLASWSEAYHESPRMRNLPWAVYKEHVVPGLAAVLDRDETRVLVATVGDAIVGWIAYVPGRRVATVHWVHTRYCIVKGGEPLRRRGVMTELLAQAQLGSRFVYTHRGPRPRKVGPPSDEWIVKWLAGRGVTAAYVSIEEWKR